VWGLKGFVYVCYLGGDEIVNLTHAALIKPSTLHNRKISALHPILKGMVAASMDRILPSYY
jgi:hypothetical protein